MWSVKKKKCSGFSTVPFKPSTPTLKQKTKKIKAEKMWTVLYRKKLRHMWNTIFNSGFITVSVHTTCVYIHYRFLLLLLWLVQRILRFTSQDVTFGVVFTPTFAEIQHVTFNLHPLLRLPAFLWSKNARLCILHTVIIRELCLVALFNRVNKWNAVSVHGMTAIQNHTGKLVSQHPH